MTKMNRGYLNGVRLYGAILLASALLVACGGGGGDGGTPPPMGPQAITPAGGTVVSANNQARLVVPAGAATQSMNVTLSPEPHATLPSGVGIVPGSIYQLTGDGNTLTAEAELTITLPETNQEVGAALARSPGRYAFDSTPDIVLPDLPCVGLLDVLGGEGNAPSDHCIEPPKIVKITPMAVTPLTKCVIDILNIRCALGDLTTATFGVLFDETLPDVTLSIPYPNITAPGTLIVGARATDNLSVKRVELIEQKIVNNVIVATTVVASVTPTETKSAVSADLIRSVSSADNATYRYRAWVIDGNGNQKLVIALGNQNDVVVNIPEAPAADSTPPTISLLASANSAAVGQSVTLTASASDNIGVTLVEFFRDAVKIGEDSSAPYALATAAFTAADLGSHAYTAVAKDAANNSAVSSSVPVIVTDGAPPTVSLTASASGVLVGSTVTLTANASDNVGVTLVEFFRNGAKVGEDASAPYEFTPVAFGNADIGIQSFTAKASDASLNSMTSAAVNVTVSAAVSTAVYVNPTGLDINTGSSSAPFKTLNKAFTTVGAGGTVWLQNGNYTATTEGIANVYTDVRTVPAGVSVKAVNAGAAVIGFMLQFPNGGNITGVNFDASSQGRIRASGGTLVISAPRWIKSSIIGMNDHAIEASGTAKVLVDPNGVPTHNYSAAGALLGFAFVRDTAELSLNGGVLDGITGQSNAFMIANTAKLSLANFKLLNTSNAWAGGTVLFIGGGTVALTNVEINLAGPLGVACLISDPVAGVFINPYIKIQDSIIANCNGGGMQLREGIPSVEIVNSQITGHGRYGIEAGKIGFDGSSIQYASPNLVLTNTTISGNYLGGVSLNNGGGIVINGGTIDGGAQKGIQLLKDDAVPENAYSLRVRGTTLSGNDALVLQGNAANPSAFDLGKQSEPGGNTITTTTGTGVQVSVEANVTVYAVGNTWKANVQGADGAGHYSLASGVCAGANPCDVLAGSGANYTFNNAGAGAALRLAE